MSCLRICGNNLVESNTFVNAITATTQVSTLGVSNLLNSIKSRFWRSTTANSAQTIRVDFTAQQTINMLALCFTNLSATATVKAYLRTNTSDASPVYTTPSTLVFNNNVSGQSIVQTQKSYSFGNGSQSVIYFPDTVAQRIDIEITDTSNADGYLQVGTLFIGQYWSPSFSFERGQTFQIVEESKHLRTESSDLVTDVGVKYRKISFNMGLLNDIDRNTLLTILRSNGISVPLFIGLYADNTDKSLENMYTMQGKLESLATISNPVLGRYAHTVSFIEI